jgi:hypothetical protein
VGGNRELARRIFEYGVYLVVAMVVIQVLLAGLGVFAGASWFFWHAGVNGALLFLVPLVLILIGWYGGVPVRTRLLMLAIPGLVILQSVFLFPYRANVQGPLRAIAGLHAANALFIFWVSLQLLDRVRVARKA